MAKYTLLIYGDPARWDAMTDQEWEANHAGHEQFRAAAGARVVGGQQLEGPATATTLRGAVTSDGPFLETKEVLGGFYLLEAADLDEVLALAKLLPEVHAGHTGVEIRPVVDHG
ncbi:YciI family protein [Actinoplanes sp. URMC 104]|uniref:YciI family protein n=1 Tax=Actinoplanes sp. URMC 104 TaxID=3423409 RepID=UPI003F1BD62A